MIIVRYFAEVHHTEIYQLELVVLSYHQVKRRNVVIYQLLVLCKLLDHINCL